MSLEGCATLVDQWRQPAGLRPILSDQAGRANSRVAPASGALSTTIARSLGIASPVSQVSRVAWAHSILEGPRQRTSFPTNRWKTQTSYRTRRMFAGSVALLLTLIALAVASNGAQADPTPCPSDKPSKELQEAAG